jgi:hypothetical protein
MSSEIVQCPVCGVEIKPGDRIWVVTGETVCGRRVCLVKAYEGKFPAREAIHENEMQNMRQTTA